MCLKTSQDESISYICTFSSNTAICDMQVYCFCYQHIYCLICNITIIQHLFIFYLIY